MSRRKTTRRGRREFLAAAGAGVAGYGVESLVGKTSAAETRVQEPGGRRPHVAVVGAGAFGGWTALHLRRKGARVTLIDSWGPGNSRASSGGETRIIRGTYGRDAIYYRLVARALELWKESERRFGQKLYHRTGVLWMVGDEDAYERASLPLLRKSGFAFHELTTPQASRRFPQIHFEGVRWAIYEPDAGYLLARRACQAVLDAALNEGVDYRQLEAAPKRDRRARVERVDLSDGTSVRAEQYVFACGAWLGKLFPELMPDLVTPTRQEVFYFGPPAGDPRYVESQCPAWIDNSPRLFYGIPGSEWRGFKIADDTRGAAFDPTSAERTPTREAIANARRYLEFRFPGLKDAPLIEARVCPYENSPDGEFFVDRHPESENVWLVGGGSGHGFKHGPALGELVAQNVLGERPPEPFFSLSRFR